MTKQTATPKANHVGIIFGIPENGKPCGARFAGVPDVTLTEAAHKVGLAHLAVDTPALRVAAQKMPAGRVLGDGKLVLPPIKKELYEELTEFLDEDHFPPDVTLLDPDHPSGHPRPKNWDEIAVGHHVIALLSPAYGWWECVVLARDNDLLTMRLQHFPKYPPVQQYVGNVALMQADKPKA